MKIFETVTTPMAQMATVVLSVGLSVVAWNAQAQPAAANVHGDHATHAPHSPHAGQGQGMADGEVKKIDKSTGKITLKHGEIKNLDMPPMTMVFTVKDKAMLESLNPGDKVQFEAVSENGKMVVTKIQRGPQP